MIDFKNKEVNYKRILQDLKKILQDLKNYSQKGLLVTLLIDVKKNLKTGNLKTIQIWIQFFLNKMIRNRVHFFTCILPHYVAHDISKEFWKNSHFENVTAVFLLRCQNSLRWEISLICHWNIDSWKQKLSFVYVMVPKSGQNII